MKQQPFGSSCSIVTNLLTHPVSMKQHLGLQLFYLLLDLPGPGFLGHMCVCVFGSMVKDPGFRTATPPRQEARAIMHFSLSCGLVVPACPYFPPLS